MKEDISPSPHDKDMMLWQYAMALLDLANAMISEEITCDLLNDLAKQRSEHLAKHGFKAPTFRMQFSKDDTGYKIKKQ